MKLQIKGTHCPSCKALIEEVGLEQPGVQSITVNYQTGATIIEHDDSFDLEAFKQAVAELGDYTVS